MPVKRQNASDTMPTIGKKTKALASLQMTDLALLQREKEEQQLLLSINKSIALVKDKKDILRLIYPKLKALFNTDDFFICRFDSHNNTIIPFLRLAAPHRQQNPSYAPLLTVRFSALDRFFQDVLQSEKPISFSYEEVMQSKSPPDYTCIAYHAGLREGLSIRLQNDNETLGVLMILSEKKGAFDEHHKQLIEQLADQVTIIVNNILDREQIVKKERENKLLLSVNHAIASIRNKGDLVQTIQKTLQSTLCFSDLAITRFNLAKGTFRVFLESCETTNQHPDFNAIAFSEYPIDDGIHNLIRDSAETVVLQIDQLVKEGRAHIQFLQQAGIKELAGIRLQHNNVIIGTLVLLSTKDHSFPPDDQLLIREVSHHFATAMVNLIYHEELAERSREKESLLSVSSAFSSIRHKEELMPILQTQLTNLSFYNDLTIAIVDGNGQTFSGFLVNEKSVRQSDKTYPQMRAAHHRFPDGVFEIALHSREPILFDLDEIVKKENAPSYVRFLHQHGTVHMIGISLRDRNQEIGVLFLFSDKKRIFSPLQLKVVQGIGDQLASTIANILANEEIAKREHEKTVLLSFSNEIAAARNKEDLFRIIKTNINAFFQAEGFAIGLVNEVEQTYTPYLFDLQESITSHKDFNTIINQTFPVNDGVFNRILASDDPIFFHVEQLQENDGSAVITFWKSAGMQRIVGFTLRVGNKPVGGFFIHLRTDLEDSFRENLTLFKGICSQLSIALSNIVANEKIDNQLSQIRQYKEQLEEERSYLQNEVSSGYTHSDIIGQSHSMQQVFHLLSQVSHVNSTVLILGETGTGKELIARAIHNASPRKDNLLVKVNCAVLPANLVESELFGHEKGSFTGATERRLGKFELANNGTLFLDEIGELPPDMQAKLLRAIQEKEVERIGGRSTIKINVRLIAATNRDLQQEVDAERFRRDLYYRLNVFPILLPPLRERKEDIPLLVAHFIEKYARNAGKKIKNISGMAMKELLSYSWPGNVRELEHLIERSILLTEGETIRHVYLPTNNKKEIKEVLKDNYLKTLDENEREHILQVLNYCKGKIFGPGGAAEILNVKVSTLNSRMKKLGIRKNKMYS
ncbi:MAG TPA: sigma 54-interacting transcriptional regulator [Flavisolibacter sp.]|nr:sigma 54-interacting transcriptional regulator [Flavisolibacter sp.]